MFSKKDSFNDKLFIKQKSLLEFEFNLTKEKWKLLFMFDVANAQR